MTEANLVAVLHRQAERLGPRPAVRHRRHGWYADLSWHDYFADACAVAAALVEAGIQPGDRVGILSENRLEWLLADMGLLAAGAVNVPPHAPLTARQIHFQLVDAGARWLFLSTPQQRGKIESIRGMLSGLKGIVAFDRAAAGEGILSWEGFLQQGRRALRKLGPELDRRQQETTADTLATIMYTSGTTGNPKGVMLTHGNLLSNAAAVEQVSPHGPGSVALGWLPLSHIYARTCDHYLSLVAGSTLALADSPDTVVRDLAEIRPTHLSSVPRLYEKVLAAVGGADSEAKCQRLRAIFGSGIEWLGSGGAPLPMPVAQAYRQANLLILQGYGLTESSPVITFNHKGAFKQETVGRAIPGVEVKIGPDGEILTRGPHVMQGYWNNPEASDEALRGGWLCTGDLGHLDGDGFLTITGRKKDLLVLSNGKKVVPAQIEGLILGEACVDQVVVHGEGMNFLTALVVPNWASLKPSLTTAGILADCEPAELARDERVRHHVLERIGKRLSDLASWEQVRKIILVPRPFSVEGEELTVSLKVRRNVVLDRWKAELEKLYQETISPQR